MTIIKHQVFSDVSHLTFEEGTTFSHCIFQPPEYKKLTFPDLLEGVDFEHCVFVDCILHKTYRARFKSCTFQDLEVAISDLEVASFLPESTPESLDFDTTIICKEKDLKEYQVFDVLFETCDGVGPTFSNVACKDVRFLRCAFGKSQEFYFSSFVLPICETAGPVFTRCSLSNCHFFACSMQNSTLDDCRLFGCSFTNSDLTYLCPRSSIFEQCNFDGSILERLLIASTKKDASLFKHCLFDHCRIDNLPDQGLPNFVHDVWTTSGTHQKHYNPAPGRCYDSWPEAKKYLKSSGHLVRGMLGDE